MKFHEKLSRLTAGKNKSALAEGAGLPASAVSNYIFKRQMPRGDKALALARVLGVPLEWLVDDAQDFPPPSAHPLPAARPESEQEMEMYARGVMHRAIDELRGEALWMAFSGVTQGVLTHVRTPAPRPRPAAPPDAA
jgi:transcriptional regulator with XRE-family HTH domain